MIVAARAGSGGSIAAQTFRFGLDFDLLSEIDEAYDVILPDLVQQIRVRLAYQIQADADNPLVVEIRHLPLKSARTTPRAGQPGVHSKLGSKATQISVD
jgi:hypothetical protein